MKFEEFLQQKHAEQYRGVDDDMAEDYERWIMELEIEQIIQFAERWHSNLVIGLLDRFAKLCVEEQSKYFFKEK